MSSDPFVLLGLDRKTASDADVRRAYAERLKQTWPEDDRAGFMALRAAFEQARQTVRWRDTIGRDNVVPEGELLEPAGDDPSAEDDTDWSIQNVSTSVPLVVKFVSRLNEQIASGLDPNASTKSLLTNEEFSGIGSLDELGHSLRRQICEQTGLVARWEASGSTNPAFVHWMQLWPFENPYPIKDWPSWICLGVLDELNQTFFWTEEHTFNHLARLENQWISQVIRELIWAVLPEQDTIFNRFASAIRDPYRWPNEDALMRLLKAGPAMAGTAKDDLSGMIRQLILSETQFGKRLIVSDCPRWLNSSLYDKLDHWFGWTAATEKVRRSVNREKARLHDMSKKRIKGTPLEIREAAWLEIVREEAVWVRLPASSRRQRSFNAYEDTKAKEHLIGWIALLMMMIIGMPALAWLGLWMSSR